MEQADETKPRWYQEIGEEKLLALLLLGLGLALLAILLLWRSLDQQDEADVVPVAESKRSIWFDKDGPKGGSIASVKNQDDAKTSSELSVASEAELLRVKTVDLDRGEPDQSAIENPGYYIQLASFSVVENADGLAKKIAPSASQVEVVPVPRGNKTLYVVRIPVSGSKQQAQQLSDSIATSHGLKPLITSAGG